MGRPFVIDEDEKRKGKEQEEAANVDSVSEELSKWRECLRSKGVDLTAQVEAVLQWLPSVRRIAYVAATDGEYESNGPPLSRFEAKAGGLPFMLSGEEWPRSDPAQTETDEDAEMVFVWQFYIQDLLPSIQRLFGVESGLFQLFFEEELPGYDINEHKGYYLARIIPQHVISEARSSIAPEDNMCSPTEAKVLAERPLSRWEAVVDYPHLHDLMEMRDLEVAGPDVYQQVIDLLSERELVRPVGGDKLGGWPNWCQANEWAMVDDGHEQFVHVMQIEGDVCDVMIGDSGTLVVQRHPVDVGHWRVGWACC